VIQGRPFLFGERTLLFQSTVPQIFNQMGLGLYNSDNVARKNEHTKRLNFYHDAQLQYLDLQLKELFSQPEKMLRLELNIVKKVINSVSQTYTTPPIRTITGTDRDKQIFSEIVESSRLDLKLKQASRYLKLLKTVLLRVTWRNNHCDLDILTGNLLDIEWADTAEDLKLVMITDFGNSDRVEDVEYSLWSPTTWQRLNYKGDVINSEPNPYKILPFIPIFDYLPTSNNFWIPGGDDLISQQEAINVKLVDLLHLIYFQSFGVGYIRDGLSPEQRDETPLGLGPGSLVELSGADSEIGFVSQKAEIRAVVEAIDKLLKWTCVCQGLSAAAISTDPSAASGISKVWDSVELSEMRIEDKILWNSYEKQIFNLIRIVHNTHSKDKLSESATLKVNFSDPARTTDSPLAVAQAYTEHFKMGTMSPVDILLEMDKDLRSREEALERLKQKKQETEELSPNSALQGVKTER
jgi:Phage portal protein, SPP1 Gp6-like